MPTDASVDALLDALTCEGTQLACGGACVDPLSTKAHCGDCDTTCDSRSDCRAGHCEDASATCATLHAHDSTLADGTYTLLDSSTIYCDMTDGGIAYSNLAFDNYIAVPPDGYSLVTTTDYQTVATQKAFIALYNAQNGSLPLLVSPMTVTICCMKSSMVPGKGLYMSNAMVQPATVGAAGPLNCVTNGSYTETALSFVAVPSTFASTAMAADWFTSHPMVEGGCPDGNNPGLFWKKVLP